VRNVTITLDDETAMWARVEAARNDTSVSRFVGQMLRRQMLDRANYARAQESFLSRGPVPLGVEGERYPSRDEVHER
jgi:hypothetical protein